MRWIVDRGHEPFFPTVSSFIFPRYYAAPLTNHDLLILGGPVMGGTGIVPHCAILSSFSALMGKVSRAAARGASFRAVAQPFKLKKIIRGKEKLLHPF